MGGIHLEFWVRFFLVAKPFFAVLGISFMASFWVGFDGWQILSEAYILSFEFRILGFSGVS